MSITKKFGEDRCTNCGEYGAHFVPPSMGEEGFFHCLDIKKCEICEYKRLNHDGGWCYMFRDKPPDNCVRYKELKGG